MIKLKRLENWAIQLRSCQWTQNKRLTMKYFLRMLWKFGFLERYWVKIEGEIIYAYGSYEKEPFREEE